MTTLVTGGCGFVGRHLVRRLLAAGDDVWIVDDLSTGLHPDQWIEAPDHRSNGTRRLLSYRLGRQTLTFIHEDLTVTMLKLLGVIPADGHAGFPPFDRVFALASIVGGRTKIDGDPMGVGMDLALDALFFLW